eukprot:TRINITY_DN4312_c0_g1_i6.p1 TRINITY_DN4312_c0_g1~~TRINITY_DN4312_c0_g1_i6.p1  ORF type:complete len:263 (+),score=61.21 TRINITY_DN4312_c0_g1_i6:223-1011(+)
MNPGERKAVGALRAWNIELASAKTSGAYGAGEIRMMWWKDELECIFKGIPRSSPLSIVLGEAISGHNLTKSFFLKIINARIKDLRTRQPSTLIEMEEYCEETASCLLYLTLEILGVKNTAADHVASHLGKAMGLVTLLRGLPYHQNDIYLPMELTTQHRLTQEALRRIKSQLGTPEGKENMQKLQDVVFTVASRAHDHLNWARQHRKDVPKAAIPAFLPSSFCEDFLQRLQKEDFDPYSTSLLTYGIGPRLKATTNFYFSKF